jgi:hypothetical protein
MSEEPKTAQQKYRENNRDKINEYEKIRRKNKYQNDEEYREKKRKENLERYHKYKEEGKNFNQYIQKFKEKHPGYYTEYNKQYNKPYYEENKERILKMVGEKVMCEYCNKPVRKDYVHKHIRTPKHIKNVRDYEEKLNEFVEQMEQNE